MEHPNTTYASNKADIENENDNNLLCSQGPDKKLDQDLSPLH